MTYRTVGAIALALCLAAPIGASSLIVKEDAQFYTRGAYAAFASPWSTWYDRSLVHNRDYWDRITIDPATFPANTTISTHWPTRLPSTGVWGYHHVFYGNYDGGVVQTPIAPRQVKAINTLRQTFSYSATGSNNYNLLNEFYLTSAPGKSAAKVIEIGYFLNAPAQTRAWNKSGQMIGILVDAWRNRWTVTKRGTFVTITPYDVDVIRSGTIDVAHMLRFLRIHNVITGDEWFNGIAFGVEPTVGAGDTTVKVTDWQVTYN